MRYIAPAGTKISFLNILNWFKNIVFKNNVLGQFKNLIKDSFHIKHVFFFGTGRTGMSFLLKTLYELDNKKRNEVIVPSYTCYSVPASAEFAGLKVRILDIDPKTLDYNHAKLEDTNFDNVLALVSSNLYGIPNNLPALEKLAKKKKIYFIDDAAQSLGAKVQDRFAGTFGDAGLFSLDKGKNLTSLDGGIIVTNSDKIAKKLQFYEDQLLPTNILNTTSFIFKVLIYSIFLHPFFYWIPTKLPFLNLGTTRYDAQMPLFKYDKVRSALGIEMFRHLKSITSSKVKNGIKLRLKLKDLPGVFLPKADKNSMSVYLRVPVLVDVNVKDKIVEALNIKGIGASGSYPKSILDVDEIKHFCNQKLSTADRGRQVAKEIITLPTHVFLNNKDIRIIYNTFKQILQ